MFLGAWFLAAGELQFPSVPDDSAMSQVNEASEIQEKKRYLKEAEKDEMRA